MLMPELSFLLFHKNLHNKTGLTLLQAPAFYTLSLFFMSLLCIACNNLFVSLAVIFFMGFLTVAVGGLKLHHYISMLLVPIIFLIFGTIAIAIGFSMHPVGQYHVHFLNLFYIYCSKQQ